MIMGGELFFGYSPFVLLDYDFMPKPVGRAAGVGVPCIYYANRLSLHQSEVCLFLRVCG